jgi:outer membrane protein OmpA-like peptidoglycan-associated protein
MGFSNGTAEPGGQGPDDRSANRSVKSGAILGAIAVALVLVLGYFSLRSFNRLERQLAGLSQQTGELGREVQSAEQQSQASAQQASQAAASAQAAAQQRDQANQAQAKSDAEAQSALEQAAAARQQASEAEQKSEEYRKQREAELARLQQVLGEIAETRRTALGLVMTLGDKSIRFDFDKSEIKPEYRDGLNRIAGVLMTLKGYSISVYGYTDDVGSQAYNLNLSKRRAEAVRDFLLQAGIPKIITTQGFGKSDPRVRGDTPQARAANRRVEIGLVDSTLILQNESVPQK